MDHDNEGWEDVYESYGVSTALEDGPLAEAY